jgi:hypothetical protein
MAREMKPTYPMFGEGLERLACRRNAQSENDVAIVEMVAADRLSDPEDLRDSYGLASCVQ